MEKLKFYIQLFADSEETPTEQVESEPNTTTNGDDEEVDDDYEVEVDGDNQEDKPSESQKQETKPNKNTSKQNGRNAQRRIEEKAQREKEINDAKKKAYLDGLKEAVGNVNPWTNEPIEDETDVEIFREMKEMEKQGLDPIEDYAKFHAKKLKEQAKAENEAKQKEQARLENIRTEIAEFDKQNGNGSAEKFLNDEGFKNSKYFKYLGRLSLGEVYDLYTSTKAETEAQAEEIAVQKEAIRMSSAGSPGNQNTNPSSFMDDILKDDKKFREFQRNLLNKY